MQKRVGLIVALAAVLGAMAGCMTASSTAVPSAAPPPYAPYDYENNPDCGVLGTCPPPAAYPPHPLHGFLGAI